MFNVFHRFSLDLGFHRYSVVRIDFPFSRESLASPDALDPECKVTIGFLRYGHRRSVHPLKRSHFSLWMGRPHVHFQLLVDRNAFRKYIQPYNTTILQHNTIILQCCNTTMLWYFKITILRYRNTAILQHYYSTVLQYCSIAVLQYCSSTILQHCHNAIHNITTWQNYNITVL